MFFPSTSFSEIEEFGSFISTCTYIIHVPPSYTPCLEL